MVGVMTHDRRLPLSEEWEAGGGGGAEASDPASFW
jgi:formylglycine-generating enzyme required for sulfatase activity